MKEITPDSDKNFSSCPGILISIDPGRSKSGIAVMTGKKSIIERKIIPTGLLESELSACISRHKPDIILMGNGTFSKNVRPDAKKAAGPIPLVMVDEKHSTERARELYFRDNPPKGIWKLIPLSLQVPKEPVDDYAAVVMASDYLNKLSQV